METCRRYMETIYLQHNCEEAFQIERETDFDKLDLSIRGALPEPLYYQIILTLNP